MKSREAKVGSGLLAWSWSLRGAPRCLGNMGFTVEPDSPGMSLSGETLHPLQLPAGNLWLDWSMSAEPEPKALWFPGVTTAWRWQKAEQNVLALSACTTSGLH